MPNSQSWSGFLNDMHSLRESGDDYNENRVGDLSRIFGVEPSGRMHIAQGVMKTTNVNKLTSVGCHVKIWIAVTCPIGFFTCTVNFRCLSTPPSSNS
ncbi:Tyrosine--tRNA ligase 2 [Spatholobus suberectus]|nr:Tyrosine--tRNA ligase 2 [Spatholobus suberectus]